MTAASADGRYGHRAWDRPKTRPGEGVDPSPNLNPAETVFALMAQAPPPPPAQVGPRFHGMQRSQPGVVDVLSVAPTGGSLMQDTPTRQDSGMQGSSRYSLGAL